MQGLGLPPKAKSLFAQPEEGKGEVSHIAELKLLPRFMFGFTKFQTTSVAFASNDHVMYGIGDNFVLHDIALSSRTDQDEIARRAAQPMTVLHLKHSVPSRLASSSIGSSMDFAYRRLDQKQPNSNGVPQGAATRHYESVPTAFCVHPSGAFAAIAETVYSVPLDVSLRAALHLAALKRRVTPNANVTPVAIRLGIYDIRGIATGALTSVTSLLEAIAAGDNGSGDSVNAGTAPALVRLEHRLVRCLVMPCSDAGLRMTLEQLKRTRRSQNSANSVVQRLFNHVSDGPELEVNSTADAANIPLTTEQGNDSENEDDIDPLDLEGAVPEGPEGAGAFTFGDNESDLLLRSIVHMKFTDTPSRHMSESLTGSQEIDGESAADKTTPVHLGAPDSSSCLIIVGDGPKYPLVVWRWLAGGGPVVGPHLSHYFNLMSAISGVGNSETNHKSHLGTCTMPAHWLPNFPVSILTSAPRYLRAPLIALSVNPYNPNEFITATGFPPESYLDDDCDDIGTRAEGGRSDAGDDHDGASECQADLKREVGSADQQRLGISNLQLLKWTIHNRNRSRLNQSRPSSASMVSPQVASAALDSILSSIAKEGGESTQTELATANRLALVNAIVNGLAALANSTSGATNLSSSEGQQRGEEIISTVIAALGKAMGGASDKLASPKIQAIFSALSPGNAAGVRGLIALLQGRMPAPSEAYASLCVLASASLTTGGDPNGIRSLEILKSQNISRLCGGAQSSLSCEPLSLPDLGKYFRKVNLPQRSLAPIRCLVSYIAGYPGCLAILLDHFVFIYDQYPVDMSHSILDEMNFSNLKNAKQAAQDGAAQPKVPSPVQVIDLRRCLPKVLANRYEYSLPSLLTTVTVGTTSTSSATLGSLASKGKQTAQGYGTGEDMPLATSAPAILVGMPGYLLLFRLRTVSTIRTSTDGETGLPVYGESGFARRRGMSAKTMHRDLPLEDSSEDSSNDEAEPSRRVKDQQACANPESDVDDFGYKTDDEEASAIGSKAASGWSAKALGISPSKSARPQTASRMQQSKGKSSTESTREKDDDDMLVGEKGRLVGPLDVASRALADSRHSARRSKRGTDKPTKRGVLNEEGARPLLTRVAPKLYLAHRIALHRPFHSSHLMQLKQDEEIERELLTEVMKHTKADGKLQFPEALRSHEHVAAFALRQLLRRQVGKPVIPADLACSPDFRRAVLAFKDSKDVLVLDLEHLMVTANTTGISSLPLYPSPIDSLSSSTGSYDSDVARPTLTTPFAASWEAGRTLHTMAQASNPGSFMKEAQLPGSSNAEDFGFGRSNSFSLSAGTLSRFRSLAAAIGDVDTTKVGPGVDAQTNGPANAAPSLIPNGFFYLRSGQPLHSIASFDACDGGLGSGGIAIAVDVVERAIRLFSISSTASNGAGRDDSEQAAKASGDCGDGEPYRALSVFDGPTCLGALRFASTSSAPLSVSLHPCGTAVAVAFVTGVAIYQITLAGIDPIPVAELRLAQSAVGQQSASSSVTGSAATSLGSSSANKTEMGGARLVKFSNSGHAIAVVLAGGKSITILSSSTLRPLHRLEDAQEMILALNWSPDDDILVAVGVGGVAYKWQLRASTGADLVEEHREDGSQHADVVIDALGFCAAGGLKRTLAGTGAVVSLVHNHTRTSLPHRLRGGQGAYGWVQPEDIAYARLQGAGAATAVIIASDAQQQQQFQAQTAQALGLDSGQEEGENIGQDGLSAEKRDDRDAAALASASVQLRDAALNSRSQVLVRQNRDAFLSSFSVNYPAKAIRQRDLAMLLAQSTLVYRVQLRMLRNFERSAIQLYCTGPFDGPQRERLSKANLQAGSESTSLTFADEDTAIVSLPQLPVTAVRFNLPHGRPLDAIESAAIAGLGQEAMLYTQYYGGFRIGIAEVGNFQLAILGCPDGVLRVLPWPLPTVAEGDLDGKANLSDGTSDASESQTRSKLDEIFSNAAIDTFEAHSSPIVAVRVLNRQRLVVSCGLDGSICISSFEVLIRATHHRYLLPSSMEDQTQAPVYPLADAGKLGASQHSDSAIVPSSALVSRLPPPNMTLLSTVSAIVRRGSTIATPLQRSEGGDASTPGSGLLASLPTPSNSLTSPSTSEPATLAGAVLHRRLSTRRRSVLDAINAISPNHSDSAPSAHIVSNLTNANLAALAASGTDFGATAQTRAALAAVQQGIAPAVPAQGYRIALGVGLNVLLMASLKHLRLPHLIHSIRMDHQRQQQSSHRSQRAGAGRSYDFVDVAALRKLSGGTSIGLPSSELIDYFNEACMGVLSLLLAPHPLHVLPYRLLQFIETSLATGDASVGLGASSMIMHTLSDIAEAKSQGLERHPRLRRSIDLVRNLLNPDQKRAFLQYQTFILTRHARLQAEIGGIKLNSSREFVMMDKRYTIELHKALLLSESKLESLSRAWLVRVQSGLIPTGQNSDLATPSAALTPPANPLTTSQNTSPSASPHAHSSSPRTDVALRAALRRAEEQLRHSRSQREELENACLKWMEDTEKYHQRTLETLQRNLEKRIAEEIREKERIKQEADNAQAQAAKNLEDTIAMYEAKIAQKDAEYALNIQKLENEIAKLNRTHAIEKELIATLAEDEVTMLMDRLTAAKQDIQQHRSQEELRLISLQRERAVMEGKRSRLEADREQLRQALESRGCEVRERDEMLEAARKRIEELEKQLVEARKISGSKEDRLIRLAQREAELEQRCEALASDLRHAMEQVESSDINATRKEMHDEIEKLDLEFNKHNEALLITSKNLENSRNRVKQLLAIVRAHEKERAELARELMTLSRHVADPGFGRGMGTVPGAGAFSTVSSRINRDLDMLRGTVAKLLNKLTQPKPGQPTDPKAAASHKVHTSILSGPTARPSSTLRRPATASAVPADRHGAVTNLTDTATSASGADSSGTEAAYDALSSEFYAQSRAYNQYIGFMENQIRRQRQINADDRRARYLIASSAMEEVTELRTALIMARREAKWFKSIVDEALRNTPGVRTVKTLRALTARSSTAHKTKGAHDPDADDESDDEYTGEPQSIEVDGQDDEDSNLQRKLAFRQNLVRASYLRAGYTDPFTKRGSMRQPDDVMTSLLRRARGNQRGTGNSGPGEDPLGGSARQFASIRDLAELGLSPEENRLLKSARVGDVLPDHHVESGTEAADEVALAGQLLRYGSTRRTSLSSLSSPEEPSRSSAVDIPGSARARSPDPPGVAGMTVSQGYMRAKEVRPPLLEHVSAYSLDNPHSGFYLSLNQMTRSSTGSGAVSAASGETSNAASANSPVPVSPPMLAASQSKASE